MPGLCPEPGGHPAKTAKIGKIAGRNPGSAAESTLSSAKNARFSASCYSFRARQILISNGQQTLGVAFPWAIAASLVRPHEKVISISGDGGFLYSAMELETAVRLKAHIVHMVWIDGAYDMVAVQEEQKYGRRSGVAFGPVDPVKYAERSGPRGS